MAKEVISGLRRTMENPCDVKKSRFFVIRQGKKRVRKANNALAASSILCLRHRNRAGGKAKRKNVQDP